MGETMDEKAAGRNVVLGITVICIILAAGLAGTLIILASSTAANSQISALNSQIAALQNENSQLQAWLDGNGTLQAWLDGNRTYYQDQIASLNSQITDLQSQIDALTAMTILKIVVLLPGSISDAGWNSAMYVGATALGEEMTQIEVTIDQGLGQVGIEDTMRDYARDGYKLIFCHSIQYNSQALAVALEYPNTWFIVSGATEYSANVVGLNQPLWEGAFLAGMVAGGVTNSNIIGGVAGFNYPTTAAVPNAFILGAKYINPAITALPTIFAGVWDDVGKGREAGEALIAQGADFLISRGDGLTLGVIQAASAHSAPGTADTVYMVGDIQDQHALASKTIITSNTWLAEPCMKNFVVMYRNGTLTGNRDYVWGIKYGAIALAPFWELDYKVPASVKDRINACLAGIKAGTFRIIVDNATGVVSTLGTF
ncbi:MAG TPA: BMP family ABC transporter substrate-binding protein [Candidatus Bathyarchaeia archaeon]|nr:BMP family ABC transporter substrate-binding protein [Candidatus Bathyarchaeia archaeon]